MTQPDAGIQGHRASIEQLGDRLDDASNAARMAVRQWIEAQIAPLGSVAQKDALGVGQLGYGLVSGPSDTVPPHHPQPRRSRLLGASTRRLVRLSRRGCSLCCGDKSSSISGIDIRCEPAASGESARQCILRQHTKPASEPGTGVIMLRD